MSVAFQREVDSHEAGMNPTPYQPSRLDRAISFVAPTLGLRRLEAGFRAHHFSYDAANPGRLRGASGGQGRHGASESPRAQRDAVQLMWIARRERKDNPIMGGIVHRLAMYACSKIAYKANTGDERKDQIYNDYFHDWCGGDDLPDEASVRGCDVTGRFRLRKYIETGFKHAVTDGDFGTALVRDMDLGHHDLGGKLRLQAVEADRLGNPQEAQGNNPRYIRGISINERGRPTSYRVYERTPHGQYTAPEEVLPENFLHLTDLEYTDQYRPVSWLQLALPTSQDLREWIESEKAAAKWAATFTAFLTGKAGRHNVGANAWDGQTASGTPTQDAMIGKIVNLMEGEGVEFAPGSQRPSGAFIAGVQTFMRFIALALDLPYGFVWDMGLLGGVSQRIEVMQAQRRLQYFQDLLVITQLEHIKNAVISDGITLGEIPPAFRDRGDRLLMPSHTRGDWQFGPWLTGDVGHQTNADMLMVQYGMKAEEDITAEYLGKEHRDVVRARCANINTRRRLAAETQVPLELQAPGLYPNGTQALAAMATPPSPPPLPGSQEAVGDKGVQQIIDILTAVGEGRMERAAGVQQLVQIFGMDLARAEAITPIPKPPKKEEGGEGAGDKEAGDKWRP